MKKTIASLPMYLTPETAGDHRLFWSQIRDCLADVDVEAPETLSDREFDTLTPALDALFFTQICGMPFRMGLHERVTLIATPDYGVAGCPPGYYRSAMVVQACDHRQNFDDFDGAVLAYNSERSQSGFSSPLSLASDRGIRFRRLLPTGSHLRSARMVASGIADIAAIDAVSLDCMTVIRKEGFSKDLRIIDWTEPVPGLPFVTGASVDPAPLRRAVRQAIARLPASTRCRLRLYGIVDIPASAYFDVRDPA
ncbi:MAG: PhnD/SsuA/transferrin family substrate-binding protein [Paracoccaceae bacterium]|nr:PhnD/SsuA/transferrin family substrate-binding protein [Paracoccaceae bacterium]MDE2913915.1 PhnD/SsuA/transferrin family substrate-binding protein [Paracoccaceae bacterium]